MSAVPLPIDLELLDLCAKAWDDPNPTYAAGDCRIYRTDTDDYTILVAAGSATPGMNMAEFLRDWTANITADWQADASAALPLVLAGIPFPKPLVLAGHSKGGADIQEISDMLLSKTGVPISRLVTFEAPAVGGCYGWLRRVPGLDYAHHGDGVVLSPLGRPHPRPLTWFPDPALPEFPDLFANHHIATAIRPALVRLLAAQGD